jgi:general stress protein YciG
MMAESRVKFRGFGSMPKSKLTQIARDGGLARLAQIGRKGYAEIGKKNGFGSMPKRKVAEIGRIGGLARWHKLKAGVASEPQLDKESQK